MGQVKMRAFNVKVYDGWVTGTTEVRSDANLTELVGRADDLTVQVYVDDSDGSAPIRWWSVGGFCESGPNPGRHAGGRS